MKITIFDPDGKHLHVGEANYDPRTDTYSKIGRDQKTIDLIAGNQVVRGAYGPEYAYENGRVVPSLEYEQEQQEKRQERNRKAMARRAIKQFQGQIKNPDDTLNADAVETLLQALIVVARG